MAEQKWKAARNLENVLLLNNFLVFVLQSVSNEMQNSNGNKENIIIQRRVWVAQSYIP